MAEKVSENVTGAWYVNVDCVGCGLCVNLVPDHFKMTEDDNHAYVYAQPGTEAQTAACQEISEDCPAEAIQGDGA